jgi:YegS/Rv2252/BmrU family lipid kinase
MTRRIKLIFNPHAYKGRAWNMASWLQSVVDQQGGASWSATEYPSHAEELAQSAAEAGFDVIAALGGDGTVHEVVNGLMQVPRESRPMLAAVPLGSGNDFCSNFGIEANPEIAIGRLFKGQPKPLDLGVIEDDRGRKEYWDNTFGIGFDASVVIHSYRITRLQGFTMYLWAVIQTILRNHEAPRMRLQMDGEQIEQNTLMLTLCNGPREGGGFCVAPQAEPDDGELDYAMIGDVSRLMMFRLIPEVMRGTHGRFPDVRIGRFRELEIRYDRPMPIHADGEVFAGFTSEVRAIKARILPGELSVLR